MPESARLRAARVLSVGLRDDAPRVVDLGARLHQPRILLESPVTESRGAQRRVPEFYVISLPVSFDT